MRGLLGGGLVVEVEVERVWVILGFWLFLGFLTEFGVLEVVAGVDLRRGWWVDLFRASLKVVLGRLVRFCEFLGYLWFWSFEVV